MVSGEVSDNLRATAKTAVLLVILGLTTTGPNQILGPTYEVGRLQDHETWYNDNPYGYA